MHLDYLNQDFQPAAGTAQVVVKSGPVSLEDIARFWDNIPQSLQAIELHPVDYYRLVNFFKWSAAANGDCNTAAFYGIQLRPGIGIPRGDHRLVY